MRRSRDDVDELLCESGEFPKALSLQAILARSRRYPPAPEFRVIPKNKRSPSVRIAAWPSVPDRASESLLPETRRTRPSAYSCFRIRELAIMLRQWTFAVANENPSRGCMLTMTSPYVIATLLFYAASLALYIWNLREPSRVAGIGATSCLVVGLGLHYMALLARL